MNVADTTPGALAPIRSTVAAPLISRCSGATSLAEVQPHQQFECVRPDTD